MNLSKMGLELVEWTHLAEDRDRWSLMNMVMNLLSFIKKQGIS
jgi:hypothetical protein